MGEHSRPGTRALHVAGTALVLGVAGAALASWNAWLLVLAPVVGYGPAWLAHALVERNRPATFTYPLWSLRGDLRMFRLVVTGGMKAELAGLGLTTRPKDLTTRPSEAPSRRGS